MFGLSQKLTVESVQFWSLRVSEAAIRSVLLEKGVLNSKFIGKHLCQRLFFNKVESNLTELDIQYNRLYRIFINKKILGNSQNQVETQPNTHCHLWVCQELRFLILSNLFDFFTFGQHFAQSCWCRFALNLLQSYQNEII